LAGNRLLVYASAQLLQGELDSVEVLMFDTGAFNRRASKAISGSILIAALCLTHAAQAQDRNEYRRADRIEPGTIVTVRTTEAIETDRRETRVYTAVVDRDVRNDAGFIVIPRNSPGELMVRTAPDGDLVLDLDSLVVNGERYAIRTDPTHIESRVGTNDRAEDIGGGALLGSIIGAIAGGGKGAVVGAGAGAAVGAGISTRGHLIRVPAESALTFRLERGLDLGARDDGHGRGGFEDRRNGDR
jgi:hypothetical protein